MRRESLSMASHNNKNGAVSMTRFSVNQIHENPAFTIGDEGAGSNNGSYRGYYGESNGLESNENYILSLRHLTKEALPRIDLYRNTRSISYANRPTLDELHNSTLTVTRDNGVGNSAIPPDGKNVAGENGEGNKEAGHGHVKFGWIQGVLVLNIMSLWGPMLFLRTSWLVGQGGIIEACVVIIFSTLITTITALSTSAIATNGEVKGGGTYYMLSRSLGPEYGGAIGLIFAFANMVGVAMNIVGFCESLTDLLDVFGLQIVDGGVNDTRIIGVLAAILCIVICLVGMEWEQKAQLFFLLILLASITDVIVGSFMPSDTQKQSYGITGWSVETARQNVFQDYRGENFISIFSVYFPSATGILSGANISGELKDPQSSIPKGTLLAIFITSTSYILFAIISGFCVIRDASGQVLNGTIVECGADSVNGSVPCTYGLENRDQMLELVSAWRWLIYAGNFAATLSSALACLVGAPRVFQALCRDKIYPYIYWFEKGYGKADDPIRCYALTFVIAVGFILIGDLNSIAPIMSNFFMAAFALINFAVFHASISKSPGFRPAFNYWNKWVSAGGALLCLVIMFVMDYKTAIITVVICLILYSYLYYNKPNVNWGSSNQAATYINAVKAAQELNLTEEHVKNYRPQVLILSGKPSSRPQLVDFTYYITKGIGLSICGDIIKGPLCQRERSARVKKQYNWFLIRKLKAFYSAIEDSSLENGARSLVQAVGVGKLRPNMIMLGYKNNWQVCDATDVIEYVSIIHDAFDRHMAVGILRMPNGLDYSYFTDGMDLAQSQSCDTLDVSTLNPGSEERLKTAPSTNSVSSEYMLESSQSATSLDSPTQMNKLTKKKNKKNKKGGLNIPDEIWDNIQWFHKKQNQGTIDVWWLYDDGGLTLLIPYILSTRKDWLKCKLRVFSLASRYNPLGEEQRNMAALLSKFRIDCTDVIVLPDTSKPASEKTIKDFNEIIGKFNENSALPLTDADLEHHKERSNRYLRVHETLQEYSKNATLVVMTLPMPRKKCVPTALYMAWLEMMTMGMPPFLLIRGNQSSVLTFYS